MMAPRVGRDHRLLLPGYELPERLYYLQHQQSHLYQQVEAIRIPVPSKDRTRTLETPYLRYRNRLYP